MGWYNDETTSQYRKTFKSRFNNKDHIEPFHSHKAHVVTTSDERCFYSYYTLIVRDYYTNDTHVIAISPNFNCSSSTIHQLSRYLRERYESFLSYYDIKCLKHEMLKHGVTSWVINGTIVTIADNTSASRWY